LPPDLAASVDIAAVTAPYYADGKTLDSNSAMRARLGDKMTSEPEGKANRRPPTIELTATELKDEASRPEPGSAAPEPDRDASSSGNRMSAFSIIRARSHVISGLIGAAAMAAIAAGLWFAGLAPTRQGAVAPAAEAPPAATGEDVAARLDKIEAAIKTRPEAPSPLATRLAAAEAQNKSLADSLAALTRRVDEIAAAAQSAQQTAAAAKSAGEGEARKSDLDALTNRIAALESTVKSLDDEIAQRSSAADDHMVRLSIVAEALRAAVERDAPYQAELTAAQSLGADRGLTTQLEPFAATGLPNPSALAHELATLIPTLLHAADTSPSDATFLGRLKANAQNLVRITPIDAPPGNDPSAVIARVSSDAAHADLAAARADISALPDPVKSLAADWMKKVAAREAALAASRQIAAAALAALGKPAGQ
jgi:hypothetical protein